MPVSVSVLRLHSLDPVGQNEWIVSVQEISVAHLEQVDEVPLMH